MSRSALSGGLVAWLLARVLQVVRLQPTNVSSTDLLTSKPARQALCLEDTLIFGGGVMKFNRIRLPPALAPKSCDRSLASNFKL